MGLSEPEDSEDAMIAALNSLAHKVQHGPKPHHKHLRGPKPLTKKQVDWIVAQVNPGGNLFARSPTA